MGKYGTSFIKQSQVCQGSAKTHKRINYLIVSFPGCLKKALGRGNDRPRTDIINYHRGHQDDEVSTRCSSGIPKRLFMFLKPSWGI